MKTGLLIFGLTSLLSISTVAMAAEHDMHSLTAQHDQQTIAATGVVQQLDLAAHKVTIRHDPIAALHWPAMTMRFTAQDATLISSLQPNDKVSFTFVQEGTMSLLRTLTVMD